MPLYHVASDTAKVKLLLSLSLTHIHTHIHTPWCVCVCVCVCVGRAQSWCNQRVPVGAVLHPVYSHLLPCPNLQPFN